MAKSDKKVSPEVHPILDGKFEIEGRKPQGIISIQYGTFNLEKLTEAQAEFLVAKKVPWIRKAAE